MSLQPSLHDALLGALPPLRVFAMNLCRNADQAEDLVQETITRACKNIGLFEPGTNMVAWLTTIMRNHFLSECRRARYRLADSIDDHADTLALPPGQLASIETHELRIALDRLPVRERSALVLVLAVGFSYEEVAEAARCPVGTVKSRVSRARRKISILLAADDAGANAERAHDAAEALGRLNRWHDTQPARIPPPPSTNPARPHPLERS
jgi:RNA polymerase sigma-70 factor (ECF subfamily)